MEQQQQPLSWSHLPDVCLLLIFKKLSMSDMICSVGRVCTNWGMLLRDDLKMRHVLVIADGNEEVNDHYNPYWSNLIEKVLWDDGSPWAPVRSLGQIELDTLRLPVSEFNEQFTTPLMDILPNISNLTLKISFPHNLTIPVLAQVTRLVNHNATRLVSLRLDGTKTFCNSISIDDIASTDAMFPLFDSINLLESLRHLRLNIRTPDSYPELSILSRLSTFTTDTFYPVKPLLESLRQYATGDDLHVECDTRIELDELIRLDPQLATKFIRASVDYLAESHYANMQLFCARFISLH